MNGKSWVLSEFLKQMAKHCYLRRVSSFHKVPHSWRKEGGEREKKKERERNICQWTTFYAFISLFTIFYVLSFSSRLLLFLSPLYASFSVNALRHFFCRPHVNIFFIIEIMGCIFLFVFYFKFFPRIFL